MADAPEFNDLAQKVDAFSIVDSFTAFASQVWVWGLILGFVYIISRVILEKSAEATPSSSSKEKTGNGVGRRVKPTKKKDRRFAKKKPDKVTPVAIFGVVLGGIALAGSAVYFFFF